MEIYVQKKLLDNECVYLLAVYRIIILIKFAIS